MTERRWNEATAEAVKAAIFYLGNAEQLLVQAHHSESDIVALDRLLKAEKAISHVLTKVEVARALMEATQKVRAQS